MLKLNHSIKKDGFDGDESKPFTEERSPLNDLHSLDDHPMSEANDSLRFYKDVLKDT
jgi:hypothetical protein